MAALGELPEYT